MAVLGWYKLRFGFSFIDEGMYMTDSWRLAMGDRLFPDTFVSVVRLYVLFNETVFKWWLEASLIGFRQIQFCLSLLTTLGMGWALFRWTRCYWYLPWVLAAFAFNLTLQPKSIRHAADHHQDGIYKHRSGTARNVSYLYIDSSYSA